MLVHTGKHVGLLRLCLIEASEATHRLLLRLWLRTGIKSSRPLWLLLLLLRLLLLVLAHVALIRLLLLHAVEELWLESCIACCSRLLRHATKRVVVVLLRLLLLLHLHLPQLLLLLLTLLGCVEVIHGLERGIFCCIGRRMRGSIHHTKEVADAVLLHLGLHILLLRHRGLHIRHGVHVRHAVATHEI